MEMLRRWRAFIREISSKKIGVYAANASFFLLLSLFPALVLLLSLLLYTPITQQDFLRAAYSITPAVLEPLISYLVTDLFADASVALLSASAITTAWSASRGVYSLMAGFNGIYGIEDRRNYIYRRLLCLLYTVAVFAALLLMLLLYVFGQRIAAWLEQRPIPIFRLLLHLIQLRWLVAGVFLGVVFTIIYKVFPNRHLRLRAVLPGAAASAIGWLVFTYLFSVYVHDFGANYARIYGSLSTIAISMLWLYVCICILFFGALLNYYLDTKPQALRRLFRQ